MFEPIRGGTRGGQGEFKWSDVSADKDREVSLVLHIRLISPARSIILDTVSMLQLVAGRRTKIFIGTTVTSKMDRPNATRSCVGSKKWKLTHWRSHCKPVHGPHSKLTLVHRGYEPSSKTNANAIPVAGSSAFNTEAEEGDKADSHDKEERRRLKDEKRAEKRARKELKRLSQSGAHTLDDLDRRSRRNRSRSRSPRYRSRERRSGEERRLRSRSRSRTPLGQRRSRKVNDDRYDAQSRDRDADRRRWDGDSRRDKPSDRRN